MNTNTEMTKAMTTETNLFRDYEAIEYVLNSIKNTVKIAFENKYSHDKSFMLAVVKYQQHDNGFYRVFVKDLESITIAFKEAIQYVSRTEDLYFQEEYCLLDFNKFADIRKFAEKYVHEYYNNKYDNICKTFENIKIEDELIGLIKEMKSRNLISEKDTHNINILTTIFKNRNK